ncbi:MAG TPA: hypothetical protein VG271_07830, partial [Beijerinckiaceae bacterium]|nr:hypothetical protein [Beijerinckiaceae bacterium]
MGLALIGVCGALFLNIRLAPGAAPAVAEPLPSVTERWVEIARPTPIFALNSSLFGNARLAYEARRAALGGGRRDTLTFGRFGTVDPYLSLSIHQSGDEPARSMPFFVVAARRAGDAGLALMRSGQPALLPTWIGTFEVADIVLADAGRQAPCLGFRLAQHETHLRIAGIACGGDRPLERSDLAHTLDSLT